MPTYTYPGVYIQEVPKGPAPVLAVSASTCAMVGFTDEGITNEPTLITSFPEFTSKFGTFTSSGRLPTAAFAYFQNGGQNLVVVRTVGSGATKAQAIVPQAVTSGTVTDLDPAPNGVNTNFTFSQSNTPIVPSTVKFKFNAISYNDDGQGNIQASRCQEIKGRCIR